MYELSLATVTRDSVTFVAAGVDWLTLVMPREEWLRRGNPVVIEVAIAQ